MFPLSGHVVDVVDVLFLETTMQKDFRFKDLSCNFLCFWEWQFDVKEEDSCKGT